MLLSFLSLSTLWTFSTFANREETCLYSYTWAWGVLLLVVRSEDELVMFALWEGREAFDDKKRVDSDSDRVKGNL